MSANMEPIEVLAQIPATDVKKRGWRGIMRSLGPQEKVVVTHHSEPEAAIISAKEYARISEIVARSESEAKAMLETLRRSFDERLAVLQAPDADDRLRAAMSSPARLAGKLKAGSSY